MRRILLTYLFTVFSLLSVYSQSSLLDINFSADTTEANGVSVVGASYGEYPLPEISYGDIPTDNAFEGATDGRGMIIEADPGEGVMITTPPIFTPNTSLLRCSVRSTAPHVSVYLISIDLGEDLVVSTISPNISNLFVDQYKRMADFFLPPSIGFQGIIQVVNTSETEPVTVYLDNFQVLEFDSDQINISIDEIVGTPGSSSITPTPISNPTQTQTPVDGIVETRTVPLDLPENAKPLEMVYIEPGTFMMGSSTNERIHMSDETQHQVTLTNGFYIGQYEVTQAQYEKVMGTNPSTSYGVGADYPVYYVSWYDAARFCNQLSLNEGLQPVYVESGNWETNLNANGYRLPTEAEWEYACRAGSTTRFSFGDALECAVARENYCEIMDEYMWWRGNNTYNGNVNGTKEVGTKRPNAWGLFDMHGNVWEWCGDWYGNYGSENKTNPFNGADGINRVLRGGFWYHNAQYCRSAFRYSIYSNYTNNNAGFRILLPLLQPTETTPTPTQVVVKPTPTPNHSANGMTFTIPLELPVDAKPLEMVYIEPGTFMMGCPSTERGYDGKEWPVHQVTLTQGFYMGQYEVTQTQYEAVMGTNPSQFFGIGADYPVYFVLWHDAARFCNQLSLSEGLQPVYAENGYWETNLNANGYRLPTEAEWEYACRAGTTTRYSFGDALECADTEENYCEIMDQNMWWWGNNTYNGNVNGTKKVGTKLPNPWGLFDMHGNVREWCSDWWQDPNSRGSQTDPFNNIRGSYRVTRGGGNGSFAQSCRSAFRSDTIPNRALISTGFRIVLPLLQPTETTPTPTQVVVKPTPTPNDSTYGITIKIPLELPVDAKPLEMVYIEPGTFTMGSPTNERFRSPGEYPHEVTLTHGFYMGRYEVTQAQYEVVMGTNPSRFLYLPNNPVDNVSWLEAAKFCNELSRREGLELVYTENEKWETNLNANGYRLPTEAEWEYACRAGTTTRYSFGDALECSDFDYCEEMDPYMWWGGNNSYNDNIEGTKEVGTKLPNAWGLFDMHGNVYEWCSDCYGRYTSNNQTDPFNDENPASHVKRGGNWSDLSRSCRSAYRSGSSSRVGLRVVLPRLE